MAPLDLSVFPDFQRSALLALFDGLRAEMEHTIAERVQQALPEYVDQVEAEHITGLSETTLWRERNDPRSLIVWKRDRGIRYLRSSLLAHNNRRAVVRRSSPIAQK